MRKSIATVLAVVALAACTEPTKPKAKEPTSHGDPRLARTLIGQADDATKAGDFEKARKLLKRAEGYADVPARAEIDAQQDATDDAEAESLSEDVKATAKKGECKAAVDAAMEIVGRSAGVAKFLPIHVGKSISKCIKRLLEAEDVAQARNLVDSDAAAKVMQPKVLKPLRKEVLEQVEQAIDKQMAPLLEKRDFKAAASTLDELTKTGLVTEAERGKVLDKIREAISAEVGATVERASSAKKGGDEELKHIDVLLAAGWPEEKERPAELKKKRVQLALVLACRAVKCKTDAVRQRWAFGAPGVFPIADPKAAKSESNLKSGVAVWELATGGGLSLFAATDPGQLEGLATRADVAVGWIPSKDLRDVDTSEMLPPGDALVGTRVWGPLRDAEKNYELGTVVSVKGGNCSVRRMADRTELEIARAKLRFGLTKQGTKVMGFCTKTDALEPSLIDSIKDVQSELHDPQVTLSCLDGDGKVLGVLKEGQLGSLRIPPDWLPPVK
jgi:hypothetical protein